MREFIEVPFKVQREFGQVPNTHGKDAEQSCVHVDLRGVQARVPELEK
jgi:hypothetical protein